MLVPRVKFFESSNVVAPIRPNVRNRIGIAGEFTRGPANEFRFIGGYNDFAATYGSNTSKGSLAFQAAWDQGAKEFAAVRVLGRAKPAFGEVEFSGISSKHNNVLLTLKFIGEVVNQGDRLIKTDIYTSGSYLGTISGRYWFNVREINDDNFCFIDYIFIPLGVNSIPWWSSEEEPPVDGNNYIRVQGTTTFNLEEDAGVPLAVDKGIFISFSTLNSLEKVALSVGDTWSIRVNSNSFTIPIYEDAAPNQVVNAIRGVLEGADPIGAVKSNDFDNGAIFELMEELNGAVGNKYSYHLDLQEPDGEVICEGAFFAGEKYIQIPIQFAKYIKEGADVSTIEGNGIYTVLNISDPFNPNSPQNTDMSVFQPLTKVTKVEVPQFNGGGLAVVWLDKEVNSPISSMAVFRFINQQGLKMSNYTHYNGKFMRGGEDGPRRAYRDLYTLNGIPLIRLLATSEGGWGNSLRVEVYPINQTSIRVTVRDLNRDSYNPPIEDESFVFNLADTDAEGSINVLKESKHIRGIFLPKAVNSLNYDVTLLRKSPMRLAPADSSIYDPEDPRHEMFFGPNKLKNVSLEDGYDGPALKDEDYVRALAVFSSYPVHILITPGVWNSDVIKHSMIAQAESASELEGLRIAILNAKPYLRPEEAKSVTIGYSSDRAVMVSGWSTYAGQPSAPRFGLSPDALYAGKLASIPFFVKPCARSSAGPVFGVAEVDNYKYSSMSHLQIFTDARLEILAMDPALLNFNFINGRTLAINTAWDQIQIRRTYDMIRGDLFINLQQYKSEPNVSLLRRQIATAVDSYMSTRARNGEITSYQPTLVQSPDVTNGVIDIYISFQPLYAADYINVYLRRDSTGAVTAV